MCLHRPFMAIYGLNADGINMLHLHHPCCASGDKKIPGKPPQIDTDCDHKQRGASVLPALVDLVGGFQFVEPVGMNIFGTQRSNGGKSKSGNGILDFIGWKWFVYLYDLGFCTLRFNNLWVHLFAFVIIIDYNNDTQIWSTAVRHQTLSFSKQGFRPLIYFLYVFIACKSANLSKPFVSLTTLKNGTTYIVCFCFSWRFEGAKTKWVPFDQRHHLWHMDAYGRSMRCHPSRLKPSFGVRKPQTSWRKVEYTISQQAPVPCHWRFRETMDSMDLHGLWLISRFQATNQL